jgi:hypothetical protein
VNECTRHCEWRRCGECSTLESVCDAGADAGAVSYTSIVGIPKKHPMWLVTSGESFYMYTLWVRANYQTFDDGWP